MSSSTPTVAAFKLSPNKDGLQLCIVGSDKKLVRAPSVGASAVNGTLRVFLTLFWVCEPL